MERLYLFKYLNPIFCTTMIQRNLNQFFWNNMKNVYKNHSVNNFYSSWSNNEKKLSIGVIGMPIAKGQNKIGVEEGPTILRKFGIINKLKLLGHDVKDYGNIDLNSYETDFSTKCKAINAKYIGTANRKLFMAVDKIIKDDKKCLTLGGDHSLAIGSILGHGYSKQNLRVLIIDAHPDLNTPDTTFSGHIHGMSMAFVIKEMQKYIGTVPGFEWVKPCINKKHFAYIAIRDADPLERDFLQELNIKYYTMREVDKLGIYNVVNMALENIDLYGKAPLHVSFDIDALDKIIVPSTGTPVYGGLTLREALVIGEEVAKTGNLSALDIVEVNPKLGTSDDMERTVNAAIEIVSTFFYKDRAGNMPVA